MKKTLRYADDKTVLNNKLLDLNKKMERLKKRLMEEEISFDLYKEFKANYHTEGQEKKNWLMAVPGCRTRNNA